MTPEDLNALVAEKVMGWAFTCDDAKELFLRGWHPSTDIKQAMEVVEKMKARTRIHEVEIVWSQGTWEVKFYGDNLPAPPNIGMAPTLPEAICRAALKAIEVMKP